MSTETAPFTTVAIDPLVMRIGRYLDQLAPHAKASEEGKLLREAMRELEDHKGYARRLEYKHVAFLDRVAGGNTESTAYICARHMESLEEENKTMRAMLNPDGQLALDFYPYFPDA